MRDIEKDIEIIITSKYCEIVESLITSNENLSVTKVIIFSFLYKKNLFLYKDVYRSSNKNDLILKAISLMNGSYDDFCEDLGYIIEAIDILIENRIVEEINSELYIKKRRIVSNTDNDFLNNALSAAKDISDRQLLKEVTSCV